MSERDAENDAPHNHMTRDIRAPGKCPACDRHHARRPVAHHPDCYQSTGVPADLPSGLCDCRVLRMLEATQREAGK